MEKHTHSHDEESILDVLLDENNNEPIVLYDENDKPIKFDQVAIIPMDEDLYAILKPIEPMENVADDEAIVFVIKEDKDGDPVVELETDEAKAMQVFEEYYKLLDEQDSKSKK